MIIETSKGTVSLAGATSVIVKRNALAYVPKVIGLAVAIVGLAALLALLGGAFVERAHTPWYGWLIIAFLAFTILSGVIGGGLVLLADPGQEWEVKARQAEDSYGIIIFILVILGGLPLLLIALAPPVPGSAFSMVAGGVLCLVLAAVTYWSKSLAGTVDATIAYPTHRTTIKALAPYEAGKLTAAFREHQPAA